MSEDPYQIKKNLNENQQSNFTYQKYKQKIIDYSRSPKNYQERNLTIPYLISQLTILPHKMLFKLLQTALVGMCFNSQKLLQSTIETFYDLDLMSRKKKLQKYCNSRQNCNCLIKYLIKQEVFVDIAKTEQIIQRIDTNVDLKNYIQGRAEISVGKSVTDNVCKFNTLINFNNQKVNTKHYQLKKFSYYLGQIVLKNNIFTTQFLQQNIHIMKKKLSQQKANIRKQQSQLRKKNQNIDKNQKTLRQKMIIQQFSDQYGDVLPTKCDIGIYVAETIQNGIQMSNNQRDIVVQANMKNVFNAEYSNTKTNNQQKTNNNSTFIAVTQPTIIRRSNYIPTNSLAQVYDQSQDGLVKYYLESKYFLLLVQNAGDKKLVDLTNIRGQGSTQDLAKSMKYQTISEGLIIDTRKYNPTDYVENKFFTFGLYNIELINDPKSKYIINCKLISRGLQINVQMYIRSIIKDYEQIQSFQIDQIKFLVNKNQYFYLNYVEGFNNDCQFFWQRQSQLKQIHLKFTQQTNCLYHMKVFKTKTDQLMMLQFLERRKLEKQKERIMKQSAQNLGNKFQQKQQKK